MTSHVYQPTSIPLPILQFHSSTIESFQFFPKKIMVIIAHKKNPVDSNFTTVASDGGKKMQRSVSSFFSLKVSIMKNCKSHTGNENSDDKTAVLMISTKPRMLYFTSLNRNPLEPNSSHLALRIRFLLHVLQAGHSRSVPSENDTQIYP